MFGKCLPPFSSDFFVPYSAACVRNLVLMLREGHRLRVIENNMLRRIFGPKEA
jgi:hypothetical protein